MKRVLQILRNFHSGEKSQKGSVLLPVLSLIISGSLLAVALLNMSLYNTAFITSHLSLQKSMYVCEGVANRMQYLINAERSFNSDTQLGSVDYKDYSYDRFLPDGLEHILDYHGTPVKVAIHDAEGGLDFSSAQSAAQTIQYLSMNSASDTEFQSDLSDLSNQITDYTDSDDSVTENGYEDADYQELEREPLPRNGTMQFKEELYYLPAFLKIFPPDKNGRLSGIRQIVPESLQTQTAQTQQQFPGMQQQMQMQMSGTPNIFLAGDLYLTNALGLEDSELAAVKEALYLYRTDQTPLSDSLESTLYGEIRNSPLLNWTISDYYQVEIEPFCNAEGSTAPHRRLIFSCAAADVSGPEDGIVRYLEWFFY